MTDPQSPSPEFSPFLVLGATEGPGRILVELEAFFEFSYWIAEELEDLVSRHRAMGRAAAPAAGQRPA